MKKINWSSWVPTKTCDALLSGQVVLADGRVITSVVFATVAEPRATRFELREAEPATVLLESLAVRVGVRPEIRHQVLTWRDLKGSFAGQESFGSAPGRGELNFTAMGGA